MLHAAIYHRLSTVDQNHKTRRELEAYVESRKNLFLVDSYYDATSATDTDRPQLDRLMADVRQGKVELVVVWRLARFVRSMPQLWNITEEFHQREVDLVVLKQPIDTTEGKQTFAVLRAVAEFESELMREKIRLGMAQAKARGRRVGRKPISAKKQDMARRLRAQGDTYRAIAAALKISPRTAFTYAHDVDNYEV